MNATFLITGKNGQLGYELQRSLAPLGRVVAIGREEIDLCDEASLRSAVRSLRPTVIVNAAAYTAVDKAETEPELARKVNGDSPGVLAEEAERLGALLVHYSTDYVFDGTKPSPYMEDDLIHPLSVYGQTKWEGEQNVRNNASKHLIFRTSWVYGAYGQNFVKTILRLIQERDELGIVADQIGAPTSANLISSITAHAVARIETSPLRGDPSSPYGTYHLSARGSASWHSYAQEIARLALHAGYPVRAKPNDIRPIPTTAYPLPAARPKNSLMDNKKLQDNFLLSLPEWRSELELTFKLLSPPSKPVQHVRAG